MRRTTAVTLIAISLVSAACAKQDAASAGDTANASQSAASTQSQLQPDEAKLAVDGGTIWYKKSGSGPGLRNRGRTEWDQHCVGRAPAVPSITARARRRRQNRRIDGRVNAVGRRFGQTSESGFSGVGPAGVPLFAGARISGATLGRAEPFAEDSS